jgi:hypothetical protein
MRICLQPGNCRDICPDCTHAERAVRCSIALQNAVSNPYPVTDAEVGVEWLQHGLIRSIVRPHRDLEQIRLCLRLLLPVLHLVADIGATGRAD